MAEPEALAVIDQDFDRRGAPVAEYKDTAAEGIGLQSRPADLGQAVKDLGRFIELEVVLNSGQAESEGRSIAEDLMNHLGIEKKVLLEGAYDDLLQAVPVQ